MLKKGIDFHDNRGIIELTNTISVEKGGIFMEYVGRYWNDKEKEIYNIEGRNIVLNKWDGMKYYKCFELDEKHEEIINCNIVAIPLYQPLENGDFKIIDYKLIFED